MCEDKVVCSIGETNWSGIEWSIGEVHIKSLEEDTSGRGSGGDDDMVLAHFEVHDRAILLGKTGQGVMRVGTEQRKAANNGVTGWARREGT